jgi:ATP-dependent DNA helicase RecG
VQCSAGDRFISGARFQFQIMTKPLSGEGAFLFWDVRILWNMMTITPDTPTASAPRISRRIVPALRRLGIATIRDLLFHFPSRYDEFPDEQMIADAVEGERATIAGAIRHIAERRTARGLRMAEAVVEDESGAVQVVWFNQPFLARTLSPGDRLRLSGKIARGPRGLVLQNPSYEKITRASSPGDGRGVHTGGMVPVYPETAGISSRWLRFLIKTYLPQAASIPDPLPPRTRARHSLVGTAEALAHIHFPASAQEAANAERRFIFEELLLIQLRTLRERSRIRHRTAPAVPFDTDIVKSFVQSLPYHLTDAQRRAIWEIGRDMARPRPTNRLLEGDVGSGKTVVAAAAALLAIRAGWRVAYMAPTEILARQHHATFEKLLSPLGVSVGLRTGAGKKTSAAPDIIVGTHALLHKNAAGERVGLVIVDEQHRFGVAQRAALLRHDPAPHFLSMTATPIPRTLALTIYGDLDISLLDEMPRNRKAIITDIVPSARRMETYAFVRDQIRAGRQAFVICPRIEVAGPASHDAAPPPRAYQQKLLAAEVKTVTEEHKKLSASVFPDLRVAMLHGRMKPKEKAVIMDSFRDRATDILISTSVIEVGVDVPNATIMMIEGAERFGLAQLHQLRGRVGRGAEQSYCFLLTTEDGPASRRLRAVKEAKNGFELAEKDLHIRGPGDIFGDRQWGEAGLALKGITDARLVRAVREEAVLLASHSPDLSAYPALAHRLALLERTLHME